MYACMLHVYTHYTYIVTKLFTCIHAYIHTYIHTYRYKQVNTSRARSMWSYTCNTHVYTHAYIYIERERHLHAFVYIYTHIYIYTRICVCMHLQMYCNYIFSEPRSLGAWSGSVLRKAYRGAGQPLANGPKGRQRPVREGESAMWHLGFRGLGFEGLGFRDSRV